MNVWRKKIRRNDLADFLSAMSPTRNNFQVIRINYATDANAPIMNLLSRSGVSSELKSNLLMYERAPMPAETQIPLAFDDSNEPYLISLDNHLSQCRIF